MRFSPGCACCGDDTIIDCCSFPVIARVWEVTVAGITGTFDCGTFPATSGGCTPWNGDYVLEHVAASSPCQFRDVKGTVNCPTLGNADVDGALSCDATNMILLFGASGAFGVNASRYELLKSSWDPFGPNVMAKIFGNCTGWPATLTLNPVL